MISKAGVEDWMEKLKRAWVNQDVDAAVALFQATNRYFERPFHAATSTEEIRSYWKDVIEYDDIELEFAVVAVDGNVACIRWDNRFVSIGSSEVQHLDGIFLVTFDDAGNCVEFRQWWFQE